MAHKVELTVYCEAKELSETRGSIFGGNEARLHLLADIITLDRQEEPVLVMMSLAKAIRHEAFTQTHRHQPPVFT